MKNVSPAPSRWRCVGLVVVATAFLGAGPALADEARVLVLPFSGSVPGAPDGPNRLTQVVARAAGLTGADVVTGQATFADAAALAGCSEETPECFKLVADSLRVDEVVIGDVKPTPDGGSVTITLKHFQNGEIRERSLSLPAGDIDDMVKSVAREVPRLMVPGGETSDTPPDSIPDTEPEHRDPPPPPPPTADDRRRGRKIGAMPWLLMGTGIALAGAGGGFLFVAKKKQDEVDDAPIHDAGDFDRLVELEDQGERYTRIGQGLLIGGGAVFAAGLVFAVVRKASGSSDDEVAASIAAVPLRGGAGLSWTGAW